MAVGFGSAADDSPRFGGGALPPIHPHAIGGGLTLYELEVGRDGSLLGWSSMRPTREAPEVQPDVVDPVAEAADALEEAFSSWWFRPATIDGEAVDSAILLAVVSRSPSFPAAEGDNRHFTYTEASAGFPMPLQVVVPGFPPRALAGGQVLLGATIGGNGEVVQMQVLRGAPGLDGAVVAAARGWRFTEAVGAPRVLMLFILPQPVSHLER